MVTHQSTAALRSIAVFEGMKGLLVLVVGVSLLSLIHHDVQRLAEELVTHCHLNPARHYPRIFIQAVANVTDARLRLLAVAALLYALLRLVEAYGLWRSRRWAKWFGSLSGGIYVPLEIQHLFHHVTGANVLLLLINIFVVAYLIATLRSDSKEPHKVPL
jgi:uncharacterized membrane protein (DUF2068 family)